MKGPLNGIIGLINGAIGALNSLSVTIPDWVPLVGGQTFGLNLPTIPQLAQGGIVSRRNGGTLANIGEGRYDEAVVPLTPAFMDALAGGGGTGGGSGGDSFTQINNFDHLPPEVAVDMAGQRLTSAARRARV